MVDGLDESAEGRPNNLEQPSFAPDPQFSVTAPGERVARRSSTGTATMNSDTQSESSPQARAFTRPS